MAKPKIEVKITKQMFVVSLGDTKIHVEADWQGDLHIFPHKSSIGGNRFIFQHSKPDVVRAIGQLLIKASELNMQKNGKPENRPEQVQKKKTR